MEATNGQLLTPIPDVQRRLGDLGLTTTYKLIKQGDLVKVNIGRRAFVTTKSLESYVERLTEVVTEPR